MTDTIEDIAGDERAAILLMSLGEETAADVLKHMGAKAVQKVGSAMASLSSVPRERMELVIDNFVDVLESQTSLGIGSDDYVRNVLVSALGEDKAGSLIDRILIGRNSKGLEALKWMETRAVAELIRHEHPQIIAIVLSYLDSDQSAEILNLLPENLRVDVMLRIASLDGIQPAALKELDEIMERQFSGAGNLKASNVGGVKVAANIINMMDGATEQTLIELLREQDEALSQRIEDLMFVFDNLAEVDDRSMQRLLREVENDRLVLALKGANKTVKEKILANMSKRAAEMLSEDLESAGPAKVSDVDAAQKEILTLARKLADEGEISLGSAAEEML